MEMAVLAVPAEAFVAVTSLDGPRFVAGFAFVGSRRNAEALAANLRAKFAPQAVSTIHTNWVLLASDTAALEPSVTAGASHAAFNLTVLGMLLGTPLEPDLAGHVLMVEEISEHLYATDRALFHLTASANVRRIAGLRLGRVSDIQSNDPDFGESAEEVARFWCARAGIALLGPADIGHDSANKIVPVGRF